MRGAVGQGLRALGRLVSTTQRAGQRRGGIYWRGSGALGAIPDQLPRLWSPDAAAPDWPTGRCSRDCPAAMPCRTADSPLAPCSASERELRLGEGGGGGVVAGGRGRIRARAGSTWYHSLAAAVVSPGVCVLVGPTLCTASWRRGSADPLLLNHPEAPFGGVSGGGEGSNALCPTPPPHPILQVVLRR